jgi:predicted SnoaL-like aldol condensation-catalyzing enzyme
MRAPVMIRAVSLCSAVAMMSGCATSAVYEQELAKSNAQTVLAFEETVFNKHDVNEAFEHYVGPTFAQHQSRLPQNKAAAIAAYDNLVTHLFPQSRMSVQRTVAQGNLVVTQALWQRAAAASPGVAEVDIYRLENGRIIEHWSVAQDMPQGKIAVPGEPLPP